MNLDDELRALERTIQGEGIANAIEDARFRLALAHRERYDELRAWVVAQGLAALKSSPPASATRSVWARTSDTVISRVDALTKGWPMKERRKAFRDAYPFGPRELWPYKVWCKAVRLALGIRPPRPVWGAKYRVADRTGELFGSPSTTTTNEGRGTVHPIDPSGVKGD